MTDTRASAGQTKSGNVDTVPENPTRTELKESLVNAEFPQAAHMAKEIFGDDQAASTEEE